MFDLSDFTNISFKFIINVITIILFIICLIGYKIAKKRHGKESEYVEKQKKMIQEEADREAVRKSHENEELENIINSSNEEYKD